jgi:hypothetical protein
LNDVSSARISRDEHAEYEKHRGKHRIRRES